MTNYDYIQRSTCAYCWVVPASGRASDETILKQQKMKESVEERKTEKEFRLESSCSKIPFLHFVTSVPLDLNFRGLGGGP